MTAASALLFVVLVGCGSPVPSEPAATQAQVAPAQGSLHLATGPDYDAHDPMQVRYINAAGLLVSDGDSFDSDMPVFLDRALPVGAIRVLANDMACEGAVDIQANLEVDAVLAVSDGTCTITIANAHAPGAVAHPEPRTAIGAFVVPGSFLAVRSLDPGNAFEPIRKPADGNAEVLEFEVPPGRYELTLLVDEAVLTTMEIEIKRGQDYYYNLRVVAANVPRVCGEIPRAQCEAALTEAYASGLFPPPRSADLASVLVRPSNYSGCYEPPVFDVLFDVRDEAPPIEVTVATIPRGFGVCTY